MTIAALLKKQINWFYVLSALFACWFATGNWYFLWKIYLLNKEIGIVDSICFAAGLLVEIPSGAIADIFGRRKTLVIATLLMAIGYTLMGLAHSGLMLLLTYLVFAVGYAFYSGADDALMYDNLVAHGAEHLWKQVTTNKTIFIRIASLSATAIGGLLFAINIRLPAIVRGLFFLFMLIPLSQLPENYGKNNLEKSFKEYSRHIGDGIKQLFVPSTRMLLPLLVVIQSVIGTIYVSGLLRPLLLAQAGFDGIQQPYILGIAGILTVFILLYLQKNWGRISDVTIIWILSFSVAGCFFWLSFFPTQFWLPILMLIQIIQGIFDPLTSEFINHHIASSHRATALSTLSLLQSVPYVIAAPLIGVAADTGQFFTITFGMMLTIITALLFTGWMSVRSNVAALR